MAPVSLKRTQHRLAGLVGDQRVDVVAHMPRSRAGIHGESLGAHVDGYWRVESNFSTLDPLGLFLGEYDGLPVFIRSEVHLTRYYALRWADIFGEIGDLELRARAAPVEAPAHGMNVVGVDGHLDADSVTMFVAVAADLSGARIDGLVGGNRVRIDANRASVSGEYAGPPSLFPLLVCSLLYFL